MKTYFLKLLRIFIIIVDLVILTVSIELSGLITNVERGHEQEVLLFGIGTGIGWLAIVSILNVYRLRNLFLFKAFRRSLYAWCCLVTAVMFYWYFCRPVILPYLFIALAMSGFGVGLMVNRYIFLFLLTGFKRHRKTSRKVMIIGYNNMAKKLASCLEEDSINTEIVGFCEEKENVHELSNYPIIDSVTNCIRASRRYHVNEIYSTIGPEQNAGIYRLMQEADKACIHFRLIPDLSHFINRDFYVNYLKDIPVLSLRQEPLSDAGNRVMKRAFDIVISLLVTVFILSWLIPLLGTLICIESRGPVFFRQQRTGKNKKVFYCLKFRSMILNGEAHLRQASRSDSRITKVGRFIRRTNLDEFPQFINVLKGDMSIVGPRPHMLKHTADYTRMIDKYAIRQFLLPGITGWAQIHGYRGEIITKEQLQNRVEHDIWYMENWSLSIDVKIVFLTLLSMIIGQKNAF